MQDFQFYIISGRVSDTCANPLEDCAVRLSKPDCQHETEVIAACRTNGRGEFYFEESLAQGSRIRIFVEDPAGRNRPEFKDITVADKDEYAVNFVL